MRKPDDVKGAVERAATALFVEHWQRKPDRLDDLEMQTHRRRARTVLEALAAKTIPDELRVLSEADLARAAIWLEKRYPATQDWESTEICGHIDHAIASVNYVRALLNEGEKP